MEATQKIKAKRAAFDSSIDIPFFEG